MSHYVLVHGAWEGSWGWEEVSPIVEKQGQTVTAVDLPGSYGNKQPIPQVTMDSYIKTIEEAIEPLDHKVILVGHSLGGAAISQVAERVPEKVERLIYVAAFLLKDGENVLGAMQGDADGELFPKVSFSEDQTYAVVSEEIWKQVAFHDAEEEAILRALPRLAEKQATEPFIARVSVSEEKFGSVPKTYVRAALDKIASPALQDRMIANWEVEKVHKLESGHFPALSMPEKLAQALV